jgi:iron(III) transport system permease protein
LLGEVAALGYAIPGTVLAVAIMLAFLQFDRLAGTALAGGMVALIMAYLIRFVRVAWGPLDGVAGRIRPQYVEVARSLGVPRWYRLWRVNLPLLWPGLVTAFLLALVEIAKEMPATLMLRPFGWETLAVRIYELTAEGQWEMAAVPALILVLLGAIPVAVLIRSGRVRAI